MKEYLLKYINEYNLLKQAEDAFLKSFLLYKIEEKEECLKITKGKEVYISLSSSAYNISQNNESEVVIIKYDIMSDNKVIGNYRLVIDYQTHQPVDDYLVFE